MTGTRKASDTVAVTVTATVAVTVSTQELFNLEGLANTGV
jgi:hypothetical protein